MFLLKTLWLTVKFCFMWFFECFSIIRGFWHIFSRDTPRVSIFGGAKVKNKHKYAQTAYKFAHLCVKNKFSILAGAGAGIMYATIRGAFDENPDETQGIGVEKLDEKFKNHHKTLPFMDVDNFALRKWLLIRHSKAFAIFPGGIGTLDEMTQVLTLVDTKKIQAFPIILFGIKYWEPFIKWLETTCVKQGLLDKQILKILFITDSAEKAVEHIKKYM